MKNYDLAFTLKNKIT